MNSVKISVKSEFESELTEKLDAAYIFLRAFSVVFIAYPSKLPVFYLTYRSNLPDSSKNTVAGESH